MRVHITELLVGDTISSDIFNSYGLNVLSGGTMLKERDISKLFQHQIDYVDIESRDNASARSAAADEAATPAERLMPAYEHAVRGLESLFASAAADGRLGAVETDSAFSPLVDRFKTERDVVSLLLVLNTKDDYLYQHSVQVGMLAYYIAVWTGRSEEEALQIGKAGLLHDIGKSRLSSDMLNKPGEPTPEELEELRKHTEYGHAIIRQSFGDGLIAKCALQHHERINGSGYPRGLKGSAIDPAARIVAVANVYSAMISPRPGGEKRDLLFVLRELYRLSFGELDPEIVHTFIRHMIPGFIGKRALLTTGETGRIVMTNPTDFFRPLVQIDDRFVDLSASDGHAIERILV